MYIGEEKPSDRNPVENRNEDKDDKSESPEEEKPDEGENKLDTATEREPSGKGGEEEMIETPEKTGLDTSTDSSEETEEEDVPEVVEESLSDSEKARKPVHFLNVVFEKVEKELSEKKEEDYEIKGDFDGKQKKEEVMNLLREYNKLKGGSAMSKENFDKLWRQKQRKLGNKFPYIVENVIAVLKDVKEDEEKPSEQQESTDLPEAEGTSTEFSSSEPSPAKEPDISEAPKDTFAVWASETGNICLLAKFQGIITIYYSTEKGEQDIKVPVPNVEKWKGSCSPPLISFASDEHDTVILNMLLSETSEDSWAVTSIQLNYDTSNKLFDGSNNHRNMTATSKDLSLFETPMGRSYFCPGHETVLLYNEDKKQVATVKLSEIQLQPYQVEDNKFSEENRCTQVILEGPDIFAVNETIPLAVGSTLALITLLILVGFSVHRAYRAAKPDYNSMQ
ncbi:uncharacterized protein LOC129220857 [Uloborus diversus]|uniref:uncharacterized protein LOC129220857 n=1 Tax=Uloborus diversus TaxID=327109 RepID=UPI00240A0D2F|nr:uncharacterized protein LOC129220857 [Uloborus diversus]